FDAGGGELARRQSIDLVVHHDVGQIDIAAYAMIEVFPTDSVPVAVSSGGDDLEFVIGQLGSRGHGQGAAVQGVHAVSVEVAVQVRRADDAADGQDFVGLEPQLG